jgi:hypothetical protein
MAEKRFIIEVRTKGFARATRDFKNLDTNGKQYVETAKRMRNQNKGLIASLGSLRNRILVYTFAIGGAVGSMNKFIQAASGFEDVKTRLVGLTGSVEEAEKAFATFNQIAATTPFQLQDVVNAGAQLEAFGVNSQATLSSVTDLAAFMGTTATEAASALGRAFAGGAGAADILRERGILQLIKDSQGIKDLTKITLPQFRQALLSAMVDPVAGIQGSSKRLSQTFTGAVSNMNDAITRFAARIGSLMLPSLIEAANSTREFFNSLDLQRLAQLTTSITAATVAFVGIRNGIVITETVSKAYAATLVLLKTRTVSLTTATALLSGKFALLATIAVAIFGGKLLDDILKATNAFSSLNTTTQTLTNSTQQLTNTTQQYINTLSNQTITLGISADAKDRINKILADTVLLTMQNNDVDETRIRIAQTIFQAEQNLSEALKGKVQIDREAATQGIFRMEATEALTEAEQGEFNALNRLVGAQMESIIKGKELISTNNNLATSLNIVGNNMRALKNNSDDSTAGLKFFLSTAAQLIALTSGGAVPSALLNLGSGFIGHTGGLIRNNGIQRFATGGMVQGQDNVPILAQAGEFIMQRSAVQNIGVQNLADMNRTGSAGGVTVNIQGNMIGNDEFVRDSLIPQLKEVSNQNLA